MIDTELYNYIITSNDSKRLNKIEGDFNILLNNVPYETLIDFIQKKLSKSNPNHSIYLVRRKQNAGIRPTKNDLFEKLSVITLEKNKPTIHIFQICINAAERREEWKSNLNRQKQDSSLLIHLIKYKVPIILLKIVPLTNSGAISKNNLISKNKTLQEQNGNHIVRVSQCILPSESILLEKISIIKKYFIARIKFLEIPSQINLNQEVLSTFKINSQKPKFIISIPEEIIKNEIQKIEQSNLIFKEQEFSVFISNYEETPNIIREIGILRAQTSINSKLEHTISSDLDSYDLNNHHFFIWDNSKFKIIGAYSLAEGKQILSVFGKKGFYISSLYKINKKFNEVLHDAVELGKSFILKDYPKAKMLRLLWKGINLYLAKNSLIRYIISSVSISQEYSRLSRLLIVEFLSKHYGHEAYSKLIKPKLKYRFVKSKSADKMLLHNFGNEIQKFDNLISELQFNSFRLPTEFKDHLQKNAKIIAFSRNPNFKNVLDGLLLIDLKTIKTEIKEGKLL
ncbi:MAG: GNAT family N-acetyltransferase [Saprospiraceae bacterium]